MQQFAKQMIYGSKFYTARGWLTAYSLACGYQEIASRRNMVVKLWHEGGTVYHVRLHDHDKLGRMVWDTFEHLTDARKRFSTIAREYRLTRL